MKIFIPKADKSSVRTKGLAKQITAETALHYRPLAHSRYVMATICEDKEREFQELSRYLNFFATTVWSIPEDDS